MSATQMWRCSRCGLVAEGSPDGMQADCPEHRSGMHAWVLEEGAVPGRRSGARRSRSVFDGLRHHPGWVALVFVAAWSLYEGPLGSHLRDLWP